MKCEYDMEQIAMLVEKQIGVYWNFRPGGGIKCSMQKTLKRLEINLGILTCLGANTTKVGNIKAYLLTTLYNAPMTISNYYTAEVNHDLYGSG